MAGALRQSVTGFPAAGVLTFSADFTDDLGACLPGSLLLWIIAGDKNSGTITPPTKTPNMPFSDRTANVSQALAWGESTGGETVLSGSVAANIAGGQVWALEVVDTAARGPWRRVGGKTDVDPLTDRLTVVLDPITATTGEGFGVAAAAADSVNTAGTPAWTNSWTSRRTTSSGGGQAGQWGATKAGLAKGTTQGTTFTRTGGTADNHSGLLAVFERVKIGDGVADMGALGASGSGVRGVVAPSGNAAEFGALIASGPGFRVVKVLGGGVAVFGALESAGSGIDPPPTDLPLRAGVPILELGPRAGSPTMTAGWRAGEPEVQ